MRPWQLGNAEFVTKKGAWPERERLGKRERMGERESKSKNGRERHEGKQKGNEFCVRSYAMGLRSSSK